jgi:hypothetical protein
MKNNVFWYMTSRNSCNIRRFGGTYRLLHHGVLCIVLQLPVTYNAVTSSLILFTLILEAIFSSETLAVRRATLCDIREDGIQHILIISVQRINLSLC